MSTTRILLPFGRSHLSVKIPSANLLGVFAPLPVGEAGDEDDIVRRALAQPFGTPRLRDLARPGQRLVIVTSDATRPCPSAKLLPFVLSELTAAGIPERDITIVIALGLHRPMSREEMAIAVGPDVFRRVRVINHDAADTIRLGTTTRGTPVEIFRTVVEADLRICLGNLEFHYFAGYSGGAKAILPGCASEATVTVNHAMMVQPEAVAGRLQGNPVRTDLEEAVAMVGVDFILNVLVDGRHRIVGAVAGDVTQAHRRGCEWVARRGTVRLPALGDIVLVSAGGYPKDVNLYQAQKALDNAAHAVRQGGIIILVARCPEGCGNATFEAWMAGSTLPGELLERIRERFALGGHKAASIARVAKKARIFLVSPHLAKTPLCGLEHYQTAQAALNEALAALGSAAKILVLPQGSSVLPAVQPTELPQSPTPV